MAHLNVLIPESTVLTKDVVEDLKKKIEKDYSKFDAVINTAGGFEAVKINDEKFFDSYNKMMRMNVDSALLSNDLLTRRSSSLSDDERRWPYGTHRFSQCIQDSES